MYYLIIFAGLFLTVGSQLFVKSTYKKTKKIKTIKGLNGYETAKMILEKNGINDVKIEKVGGTLTDHYDPRSKVVRLSSDIYDNPSVASVSVAAHECGHVIQHHNNYKLLSIRNSIVPLVNFSSKAGYIIITISLLFSMVNLLWIGIILESVILLFQLLTLPVEIDASRRALNELEELQVLEKNEQKKSVKMLTAAALTYVASVATAFLELLRLILIANSNSDN